MIGIVGIVVVFVMVFGGYLAAGGKMAIIFKALPFELTMIGGAAAFVGGLIIGGTAGTLIAAGGVGLGVYGAIIYF